MCLKIHKWHSTVINRKCCRIYEDFRSEQCYVIHRIVCTQLLFRMESLYIQNMATVNKKYANAPIITPKNRNTKREKNNNHANKWGDKLFYFPFLTTRTYTSEGLYKLNKMFLLFGFCPGEMILMVYFNFARIPFNLDGFR